MAGNLLSVEALRERALEMIEARAVIDRKLRWVNGVLHARDPSATDLQRNHGTLGGYFSHFVTWKTQPCTACKLAHTEAARHLSASHLQQNHGTQGGYSSHFVTWKTQPCTACKLAHTEAARERRRRRRDQKNTSLGRTDV
jgi:hypothetical protein